MAANEEQFAPEEPLSEPEQGATADSQPEVAADEAATLDTSAESAAPERPKLKLAQDESATPSPDAVATEPEQAELIGADAATAAAPDSPVAVPTAPSGATRKHPVHGLGLTTINRCLAVVVLFIICLTAFEVWSSVGMTQLPAIPPLVMVDTWEEPEYQLPPLAELLKAFEARDIIVNPDLAPVAEEEEVTMVRRKTSAGWTKYVRENLDLIGLTGGEAIVMDNKQGEMLFLRLGQEVVIQEQKLKLESIGGEQIELFDGKDRVTVK